MKLTETQKRVLELERKKSTLVQRYHKREGRNNGLDAEESKLVGEVQNVFRGRYSISLALLVLEPALSRADLNGPRPNHSGERERGRQARERGKEGTSSRVAFRTLQDVLTINLSIQSDALVKKLKDEASQLRKMSVACSIVPLIARTLL